MKKIIVIILLLCLILSGCGKSDVIKDLESANSMLNQEVESFRLSNEELSEQLEEYKAMPTITPEPPPTPTPSPTPEPTPVPEPNEQLESIIALFEKAGLPVDDVIYYDESTDLNGQLGRPNCYIGKVNFNHPESDEELPCTIEIFMTQKDLDDREAYIYGVFDAYPLLRQYMYNEGYALLRLPYEVLPSQANEYEKIFREYWE